MPLCTLISCFVKWGEKGLWGRGIALYTQANTRKGSGNGKTSIRSCSKMRKKNYPSFSRGKMKFSVISADVQVKDLPLNSAISFVNRSPNRAQLALLHVGQGNKTRF